MSSGRGNLQEAHDTLPGTRRAPATLAPLVSRAGNPCMLSSSQSLSWAGVKHSPLREPGVSLRRGYPLEMPPPRQHSGELPASAGPQVPQVWARPPAEQRKGKGSSLMVPLMRVTAMNSWLSSHPHTHPREKPQGRWAQGPSPPYCRAHPGPITGSNKANM